MLNIDELNKLLQQFNQVEKFDIAFDVSEHCYNLTLVFSNDLFSQNTERLMISFLHISNLCLKDSFHNNFQQFMSLILTKDNSQWENVNYQITQIEDDNLVLKCKDFTAYLM